MPWDHLDFMENFSRARTEPGISSLKPAEHCRELSTLLTFYPALPRGVSHKPCVVPAQRGEAAGMGRAGLEWKQLGKELSHLDQSFHSLTENLTSCSWYTPENPELEESKEPQ